MSGVEEVVGGQDGLVRVPEDQDRSAAEVLETNFVSGQKIKENATK